MNYGLLIIVMGAITGFILIARFNWIMNKIIKEKREIEKFKREFYQRQSDYYNSRVIKE